MRRVFIFIVCGWAILNFSCGGGGNGGSSSGGGSGTASTPVIANLSVSQSQMTLNQGGGAVSGTVAFDFTDSGGDLATWTVYGYIQTGNSGTSPIQGLSGGTSGHITVPVVYKTTMKGTFSYGVYVTDTSGRQSNWLTASYIVS
ncbi:MAG TPA: hypothetical protein VK564_12770 [Thermodesulfobacteriota bacterium]|nr:hypothetical protein [Thermodesulfobacteriota bacterium]